MQTETKTEQTEMVISDGSGGTMVLAWYGSPSAAATKFFHDAIRFQRKRANVIDFHNSTIKTPKTQTQR